LLSDFSSKPNSVLSKSWFFGSSYSGLSWLDDGLEETILSSISEDLDSKLAGFTISRWAPDYFWLHMWSFSVFDWLSAMKLL
jgi:hypothetical protein